VKRLRSHRRRQDYAEAGSGGLELNALGDVEILGKLGEGVTCSVLDARWRGRDVVVKLYKAGAIERHHRLLGEELVEFEWNRNRAFYDAPGLRPYVAEPLAYLTSPGIAVFVQEKLDGRLYYFDHVERGGTIDPELFGHVGNIVRLAHEAGLYDVDLHAGNLMVVRDRDGRPMPKLFDFNFIPFYIHPPNPLVGLLLKLGLLDLKSRDLRKLRNFHDFRRFERKIERFAKPDARGPG
jgi:tRNA A-37 threonylcarbamoyl transferase component Bud32